MDKMLEEYIDLLYQRQNIGAQLEQKNLFSKKDYYLILRPVIDLLKKYPDLDINELRNKLYEQSDLETLIRDYFLQKKSIAGAVFSYGTKNFQEMIIIGNQEEVKLENGKLVPAISKIQEDTIFDLASVTKVFTSLCMMKLVENNLISLSDEVIKYDKRFKNLKGVTLYDLLCFNIPLKTSIRLDSVKTRMEAEESLFNITIDNDNDNDNLHPYTDMGIMILKYVIEKVTGMSYYAFLDEIILQKYGMVDTYVTVPKYKLNRVASNNFDTKVLGNGEIITNVNNYPGIVYDAKAQVMGQVNGNLSGHAGLFSSANDVTTLLKKINDGEVLNEQLLNEIAKNRQGRKYHVNGEDMYVQYFGYMTYSKHPIQKYSEVFHALSGKSFAGAGWTGTQITVDPINELYFFLGSNRAHNRVTFIDKKQKNRLVTINGQKGIELWDGSFKVDASDFAYRRDNIIIHPVMKLLLQYKMLEDILNYYKDINDKSIRNVK